MFLDSDICGDDLPARTVSLTFDDGPGPETQAIGQFLFEHRIPATFFVIGRNAREHPVLLQQLVAWGHTVGNHTFNHPGLVDLIRRGGDVVSELMATDRLIRSLSVTPPLYFRAPYGSWREVHRSPDGAQKKPSIVANVLNQVPGLSHYIGHVHWDVCTCDYDFWRRGEPPAQCADFCMHEIRRVGRGIILLHDSFDDAALRDANRTRELVELIVPALKREGFRFVSLHDVPQIRSEMGAPTPTALS